MTEFVFMFGPSERARFIAEDSTLLVNWARSPAPEADKGIVKKSRSGICHGPSSPYYAQTQNYTAYPSIDECLASGGRMTK